MEIPVKIKRLSPDVRIPEYQTEGSAAVDMRAHTEGPVTVLPGDTCLVPTGLAIECPPSVVALIFPRSGLAIKKGITLSNCVGVIDSDYRGEIKIGITNHGREPFEILPGDRIAQMGFFPVFKASFEECDELSDTERGSGGFGHTGV